ncbi:MAG: type II toxin-antitoxin system RelE/ParE family toxin, partial [Bryobacteraceae bacterium]
RPAAKRDLALQFAWYAENASLEVASRFLRATQETLEFLSTMPHVGPVKVTEGRLAGARIWRVSGFETILILYRPIERGIAVERPIHAKRDYRSTARN